MSSKRCAYCQQEHAVPGEACERCGWESNSADPATAGKLPPELREWARSRIDMKECLAGIEEIERTGGLELRDFIDELEGAAAKHERPE